MIDITKAVTCRGWMSDVELEWLGEQASQHEFIVEIGCYAGRSTRILGDYTNGHVVTVDDFMGCDKERPLSKEDSVGLYKEFKHNLYDLIKSNKVMPIHPHDIDSLEGNPDMVFIDGDHNYWAVKRDITYWMERLRKGGLLSGHDSGFDPIQKALNELLPTVKYVPKSGIWYEYKS